MTQFSKAIKDANFKPHGGDWNLAVVEVNAKGMHVTHGKAVKYAWNRVAVAGTFVRMVEVAKWS